MFTTLLVACITLCGCDKDGGLDPALPPNLDIEITGPLLVAYGSQSTITCVAKLANSLSVKTLDGKVVASGTQGTNYTTPSLTNNSTYEIVATNGTTTAKKTITIAVTPPPVILVLQSGKWKWSGLKTKVEGNTSYQTLGMNDSAKDDIYVFTADKKRIIDFGAVRTSEIKTVTAEYEYYYLDKKLMLQMVVNGVDDILYEIISCTPTLLQLEVTTIAVNTGQEVKVLYEYTNTP